jgi:hypothetical protein
LLNNPHGFALSLASELRAKPYLVPPRPNSGHIGSMQ